MFKMHVRCLLCKLGALLMIHFEAMVQSQMVNPTEEMIVVGLIHSFHY